MSKEMTPQELPYRKPVAFFEAKNVITVLSRYYDLIRLYSDFSDPQEKKEVFKHYPEFKTINNKTLIKLELNRLSLAAYRALERINAPLEWTFEREDIEFDYNKGKDVSKVKRTSINLVLDQFMPHYNANANHYDAYRGLTSILEQTIPYYEKTARNYWKRWVNPIWWISVILRIPITLIEYMGVDTSTHKINQFIYWLIQALVLVLLSFLCLKIGLSPLSFIKS